MNIPSLKSHYNQRRQELSGARSSGLFIAPIWDRIAAFVLDFILLVLSANLLFSPIKKKLQSAILNEHDGAVQIYFLLIFIGFVALFLVYHTFCIYFYRKTLGKKIFHLEVKSFPQDIPFTFGNCFGRSVFQILSILFLGFPFLKAFSHNLRRVLHDRTSDTIVVSFKKNGAAPLVREKFWVRFAYVFLASHVIVFIFVQVFFLKENLENITETMTEPEYVCDAVSVAKENWPQNKKVSRLDIALMLFGAGEINRDCLEQEAQKYISFEKETEKSYLAMAFVYDDKAKISETYLKKVCEVLKTSDSCLLSRVIQSWSDKDIETVDKLFNEKNWEDKNTNFLITWAIRHYEKRHDYKKALNLIEKIANNKALSLFVGRSKAISLWNLDRQDEAEQLSQLASLDMEKQKRKTFLADMCRMEVENNCQTRENRACFWLKEDMASEAVIDTDTILSLVKSQKCGVMEIQDVITQYRNKIEDPLVDLYLAGVRAKSLLKNDIAKEIFENVLRASDVNSYLAYESRRYLLDVTTSKKEITEMASWWIQEKGYNRYHFAYGTQILKKLVNEKVWNIASLVSQRLMKSDFLSRDIQKQMAIAFYYDNKINLAKRVVQAIGSEKPKREIASADQYQTILKKIMETP